MEIFFLRRKKAVGKEFLERYSDLQVLDSRYIAGREHIEFALNQAEKAFEEGTNISKKLFVEILVRASCQRQIKKALALFSLGSREIVVICKELPEELSRYGCQELAEEVFEDKYEGIKEAFEITETEILAVSGEAFHDRVNALKEIIKERVALVAIG
ncbi:MAG: KEOPS complex subunit Cgi121 [Candidatus Hydrothermarchaeales archaeon]